MPTTLPPPRVDTAREARWRTQLRSPDDEEHYTAVSEIYAAYTHDMLDSAFYVLRDRDEAKDVVQELLLRFWQQHATITFRTTIRAYLMRGAFNTAMNLDRDSETACRLTIADDSDHTVVENDAVVALTAADLAHDMERAIARMPRRRGDVVEFAVALNANLDEVADILGISVRTVTDHLTQAGLDLKRALKHWHVDGSYWTRATWIHWLAAQRRGAAVPPLLETSNDA